LFVIGSEQLAKTKMSAEPSFVDFSPTPNVVPSTPFGVTGMGQTYMPGPGFTPGTAMTSEDIGTNNTEQKSNFESIGQAYRAMTTFLDGTPVDLQLYEFLFVYKELASATMNSTKHVTKTHYIVGLSLLNWLLEKDAYDNPKTPDRRQYKFATDVMTSWNWLGVLDAYRPTTYAAKRNNKVIDISVKVSGWCTAVNVFGTALLPGSDLADHDTKRCFFCVVKMPIGGNSRDKRARTFTSFDDDQAWCFRVVPYVTNNNGYPPDFAYNKLSRDGETPAFSGHVIPVGRANYINGDVHAAGVSTRIYQAVFPDGPKDHIPHITSLPQFNMNLTL